MPIPIISRVQEFERENGEMKFPKCPLMLPMVDNKVYEVCLMQTLTETRRLWRVFFEISKNSARLAAENLKDTVTHF